MTNHDSTKTERKEMPGRASELKGSYGGSGRGSEIGRRTTTVEVLD